MRKVLGLLLPMLLLTSCSPQTTQFVCEADKLVPAGVEAGASVAGMVDPATAPAGVLAVGVDKIAHAEAQAVCDQLIQQQTTTTTATTTTTGK